MSVEDSVAPSIAPIVQAVADAFNVPVATLMQPNRGRARIARARQAAMWIAHTQTSLSMEAVGKLFRRDRTTVAHACLLAEELKGSDAIFRASLKAALSAMGLDAEDDASLWSLPAHERRQEYHRRSVLACREALARISAERADVNTAHKINEAA